ncbi:MAG: hypothetical protein IT177_00890 [Acidobacteria bacterium]|nr:hypothetical protein [Acidobacteriota bacterium]
MSAPTRRDAKVHRVTLAPREYTLLVAYRALPRFAATAVREIVFRWAKAGARWKTTTRRDRAS